MREFFTLPRRWRRGLFGRTAALRRFRRFGRQAVTKAGTMLSHPATKPLARLNPIRGPPGPWAGVGIDQQPLSEATMLVKRFRCPKCRRLLQVSASYVRPHIRCKACRSIFPLEPAQCVLAVKKETALERMAQLTSRSWN